MRGIVQQHRVGREPERGSVLTMGLVRVGLITIGLNILIRFIVQLMLEAGVLVVVVVIIVLVVDVLVLIVLATFSSSWY